MTGAEWIWTGIAVLLVLGCAAVVVLAGEMMVWAMEKWREHEPFRQDADRVEWRRRNRI
jgi:hypothetical protein